MKNYETGICAVCKQPKDDHYKKCEEQKDGPCQLPNVHCQFPICVKPLGHDFKDSGIAQLEKNAPKLLEENEELYALLTRLKEYVVRAPWHPGDYQERIKLLELYSKVKPSTKH